MADKKKQLKAKKSNKKSGNSSLKGRLQDRLRSVESGLRKSTSQAKKHAGTAKEKLKARIENVEASKAGQKAKEKLSMIEDLPITKRITEKTSRMKSSYLWALLITLGLTLWLGSGLIFSGGDDTKEVKQEETTKFTRIEVKPFTAQPKNIIITASGRTEGFRSIDVLARTTGIILSTPRREGEHIQKGDLLCELDLGVRQARLAEAKAAKAEAQLNYDAAKELMKEGFASKTRLATTEARLDATRAALRQVEIDIDYTKITAPESGVLAARPAEPGSFLQLGGKCATITIHDPMLVVANISEREVGGMKQGLMGTAKLATGQILDGTVRFISPTADSATRTFRVELEVENKDLSIRDGISAELSIPVDKKLAHLISPSILTLNKEGKIGVRMWKTDNTTAFTPVSIISDGTQGVWVAGLPQEVVLVTVGHEFVKDGEKVNAVGLPQKVKPAEVSQK
jgi:multidrug efflux system membrane fusion protein